MIRRRANESERPGSLSLQRGSDHDQRTQSPATATPRDGTHPNLRRRRRQLRPQAHEQDCRQRARQSRLRRLSFRSNPGIPEYAGIRGQPEDPRRRRPHGRPVLAMSARHASQTSLELGAHAAFDVEGLRVDHEFPHIQEFQDSTGMTAAAADFAEHAGDNLVHALEVVADVGVDVDSDAFHLAGWQWLGIEFADHDLILAAGTGDPGAPTRWHVDGSSADRNIIDTIHAANCQPEKSLRTTMLPTGDAESTRDRKPCKYAVPGTPAFNDLH